MRAVHSADLTQQHHAPAAGAARRRNRGDAQIKGAHFTLKGQLDYLVGFDRMGERSGKGQQCSHHLPDRLADDVFRKDVEQAARRRVNIHHAVFIIQHDQAVFEHLDQQVARQRGDVEQAKAEERRCQQHTAGGKEDRRQVDHHLPAKHWGDHSKQVGAQGNQGSADQGKHLGAIQSTRTQRPRHQHQRTSHDQRVRIGSMCPEEWSGIQGEIDVAINLRPGTLR